MGMFRGPVFFNDRHNIIIIIINIIDNVPQSMCQDSREP